MLKILGRQVCHSVTCPHLMSEMSNFTFFTTLQVASGGDCTLPSPSADWSSTGLSAGILLGPRAAREQRQLGH
jgi:hypothetical protein